MIFSFGRFELDQPARILRLDGQDVALQPRVFDLLVYLVQNRARVVPKDELLDTLWCGVTVTSGRREHDSRSIGSSEIRGRVCGRSRN